MKKLVLLFCLFPVYQAIFAQNIGADLTRLLRLAPQAQQAGTSANNPALDTIVFTLAYYGGMPDRERMQSLLSGPELLTHFANNPAIRDFLINEKLDLLLQSYQANVDLRQPSFLSAPEREAYLRSLAGAELFSRDGRIDLGKIRQTFTTPSQSGIDLKAAAAGAADQGTVPTASLISNAIAGLSDWITRRAQEELTYTFLTRLEEDIQRNDLQFLFPQTSAFLPSLSLLNYKAILPSIRKAFTEDLNAIALNLGQYLEARDRISFRDPTTYNLFLIYRILDLNMREVALADILAFTYRELERARIDTRCQIDLRMANTDTTDAAYQGILDAFDQYVAANDNLTRQFEAANDLLSAQFFNPLLDAVEDNNFSAQRNEELLQKASDIFLPLDASQLPLKNNYRESGKEPPATGIVRAWLRGEEAYAYYEAYPSLSRFDELFGPDAQAFSPQEKRAAGLTAVREVLAHRDALEAYRKQFQRLLDGREQLLALRAEVSRQQQADSLASVPLARVRTDLLADLDREIAAIPPPEQQALRLLRKITEGVLPETKNARALLNSTRQRLTAWVADRGSAQSPLRQKMLTGPEGAASLPPLQQAITATEAAYDLLATALRRYSSSRADSLVRAYHNLGTFETIFGLAQQTFFLLSEADSDLFLDKKQMAVFQTNPAARQLLRGVAQERMGRVPDLGLLNTEGLTDFLLDFSLFLSELRESRLRPLPAGISSRQQQRIQAVNFISHTLEALLEAPILRSPTRETAARALTDRFPAFADVPAVSRELNELFRLSTHGEYRYAIEPLLNLIELFDIIPDAQTKQQRLQTRQEDLQAQLDDYLISQDPELTAIGLAAPSAARLELDLDLNKRTAAQLSTYHQRFNTAATVADREEAANNLRDLKVKRIREELQLVNRKLTRLNPRKTEQFRKNLFRYGTFMADVAAARDAADFENALSTIALPPGSSQIKRNQRSSFELGAYFGAALSQERLVAPPGFTFSEQEESAALGAALFVPVGISYSRNIGGLKSLTLFGSLLDLGAITAFRFGNRENSDIVVERLPEFRPRNIIAPGLHLLYNFPKSPFSLGIGVQDGPSVRKFSVVGQPQQREARSVRGMLTFSVDVPIFRFFNR